MKIFISEEKTFVCTGVSELHASNFGGDCGSKDNFWKISELSEKIIIAGEGCRRNNCQVGGGSVETFNVAPTNSFVQSQGARGPSFGMKGNQVAFNRREVFNSEFGQSRRWRTAVRGKKNK